jgi:hypothetical protein
MVTISADFLIIVFSLSLKLSPGAVRNYKKKENKKNFSKFLVKKKSLKITQRIIFHFKLKGLYDKLHSSTSDEES